MFVSEKIVFVELQKTGCTHIGKLLAKLMGGEQIGKHNAATPDLLGENRCFLGSVRNPWEWYISLWAYGCDSKGGLFDKVTTPTSRFGLQGRGWRHNPRHAFDSLLKDAIRGRNTRAWKTLYADVNNVVNFRKWLHMIHSEKYWNEIGEGYASSPVSRYAGLMTYRYIELFCRDPKSLGETVPVKGVDDLYTFTENNCYVDHFIRNESLETGLIEVLERCGIVLSEEQKRLVYSSGRTNTSSRKNKSDYYYDKETAGVVGEREKLIIEKFGYSPPLV